MSECWVVVADGARARFMAVERQAGVPPRAALKLVEGARMMNRAHTVSGRRAERKIKSGRDTGRGSGLAHGYTDMRAPHDEEMLRRFATRIAGVAAALAAADKTTALVLVAERRRLGVLRAAFRPLAKSGVKVRELAHDYSLSTAAQLKRHLIDNDVLPHAD